MAPGRARRAAIATLKIRVQAAARKEAILGYQDDLLRVAVQAPPVEGAANRAVIDLLARSFHTRPSRIRLLRGQKSKSKLVELCDVTAEMLDEHRKAFESKTTKTGNANDVGTANANP